MKNIKKEEFKKIINSPKAKELESNMTEGSVKIGELCIKEIKEKFSKVAYKNTPYSLTLTVIPSYIMKANASTSGENNQEHNISISYGFFIEMRKDIALFFDMCERSFLHESYEPIFKLIDYGQGIKNILPNDLSFTCLADEKGLNTRKLYIEGRVNISRFVYSWLFLHEQAHLFQFHGEVFKEVSDNKNTEYNITWHDSENTKESILTENDSIIKHIFELSADWEATYLMIINIVGDKSILKLSSLWLFISGLTILFNKFYLTKNICEDHEFKGTHPSPSVRIKYIFENIENILSEKGMITYFEEGKRFEDYQKIMRHAFDTANIFFWQIHIEGDKLPEFMNKFLENDFQTNEKIIHYSNIINNTWKEIKPVVLKKYMGLNPLCILPIFK